LNTTNSEHFRNYVQLTKSETDARNFVVELIQTLCRDTFIKDAKSKTLTNGNHSQSPIKVVTFGSFASPDVCTFTSDVDLAIWGVVDPECEQSREKACSRHIRFEEKEETNSTSDSITKLDVWKNSLYKSSNSDKHNTTILDPNTSAAQNTTMSEFTSSSKEISDAATENSYPGEINHIETSQVDLMFVLDRKPNIALLEEEQTESDQTPQMSSEATCNSHISGQEVFAGRSLIKSQEKTFKESDQILPHSSYNDSEDISDDYSGSPELCPSSDDEVDTVDKMDRFMMRNLSRDSDHVESEWNSIRHELSNDNAVESEESRDMEVGFVSQTAVDSPDFISTKTRRLVVSSLRRLGNALRKCSVHDKHELRSRARVPIIALETRIGVEADVALGGHSGTDTSEYAGMLLRKYNSFAQVVLLLKILLRQNDLDKPFTGGLGSYKLYVLVSYHIERHLKSGGKDLPSEVLISLLFRYGGFGRNRASTTLSNAMTLSSHGGMADMQPVFRLDDIEHAFANSFNRLSKAFDIFKRKKGTNKISLLGAIVDPVKLNEEREFAITRARRLKQYQSKCAEAVVRDKVEAAVNLPPHNKKVAKFPRSVRQGTMVDQNSEEDADDFAARYGFLRSASGALIPLSRPDLDAQRLQREGGFRAYVEARSRKNRKNKRKQAFDAPFQELVAEASSKRTRK